MKRKITSLVFAAVCCSTMFAQSFKFYTVERDDNYNIISETPIENGGSIVATGTTLVNWGTDSKPEWVLDNIESHLSIKNITSAAIETIGSQEVIIRPDAGTLQFCYMTCQMQNENLAQEGELSANSHLEGFHMAYKPEIEKYDTAQVVYKVVNKNNPSDAVSVTVLYAYNVNSSIASVNANNEVKVYQNGNITELVYGFESDGNRQIIIYDAVGKIISSQTITDTAGAVSFSSLNKGLYFYSVSENGKVITAQKFINR